MSNQQIDHSAKIFEMIEEKDRRISQLSDNYQQAIGDKQDIESELMSCVKDNLNLRLKIRRNERRAEVERELLHNRIGEITAMCDEQTTQMTELKEQISQIESVNKQKEIDPVPFVCHLIMTEAVSKLYALVNAAALVYANTTRTDQKNLMRGLAIDTVVRQPSVVRSALRYCNDVQVDMPKGAELLEALHAHVPANVDVYAKDVEYRMCQNALEILHAAFSGSGRSESSRRLREYAHQFDWVCAFQFGAHETESFCDDGEYADLFIASIRNIARNIVQENF